MTTVQMKRNANNSWPQPLRQTLLRALEPFPEARAVAVRILDDSTVEQPATAEVHPDEVENWTAQGWQRADTGASS
jgi:hypothetical protein